MSVCKATLAYLQAEVLDPLGHDGLFCLSSGGNVGGVLWVGSSKV